MIPRFHRAVLRPVPRQELVEQDDISRNVLDLTFLGIIRALGRGNDQAEHESGDCADEAGAQILAIVRTRSRRCFLMEKYLWKTLPAA
jgi:hypothetical protein